MAASLEYIGMEISIDVKRCVTHQSRLKKDGGRHETNKFRSLARSEEQFKRRKQNKWSGLVVDVDSAHIAAAATIGCECDALTAIDSNCAWTLRDWTRMTYEHPATSIFVTFARQHPVKYTATDWTNEHLLFLYHNQWHYRPNQPH